MNMLRSFLLAGCIVAGVASAKADDNDQIARGEYLARAADCVACHTAPGGQSFAGGRAFELPIGLLYSPNITSDPQTGIGSYTDAEWLKMLRGGVARDGKHLYPAMPYTSYTMMSDDDALAIKAYLKSVAPISSAPPANQIGFPYNLRWSMFFWNLFNNPNRRFEPDTTKSEAFNRGAYLVNGLGHCGECHTPRNFMMGLKDSKALAGAVQVGWHAYNLTSDKTSGLGNWTDEQLYEYLSSGQAQGHGPASGPMAEAVSNSLRFLKPEDIRAMVTYLRGVNAQDVGPATVTGNAASNYGNELGGRLFVQACAGCHLPNGSGRQSPWAALAGAHTAADPQGTNLIQILTHGSEIRTHQGVMFMHAFTGAYTDAELAALGRYTQTQFGGIEGTVTPEQIRKARGPDPKSPDPKSAS